MNESALRRYEDGRFFWDKAPLADECQADIFLDGRRLASVMASPAQLDFLALGFLFAENLIKNAGDLKSLSVDGLKIRAVSRRNSAPDTRFSLENIEAGRAALPPFAYPEISAAEIMRLSEDFNEQSYLFRQTGAVHSCALIDGESRYLADDVARHNALDKVIGQYICHGQPKGAALLLTTGRVSTEILLKSAKAGVGAVISRSAPTDRAVELARKLDMIMIGFSRQGRFNVYSGFGHIGLGRRFPGIC